MVERASGGELGPELLLPRPCRRFLLLGAIWRRTQLRLPIPGEFGTGTNGAITSNNLPGLSGGTYKSRELGIDNLADVP